MELDDDNKIVTYDPETKENAPPNDTDSINSILDRLRKVNTEDKQVWDKLTDATLEERGFNDYLPKKKEDCGKTPEAIAFREKCVQILKDYDERNKQ